MIEIIQAATAEKIDRVRNLTRDLSIGIESVILRILR